MGCVFFFQQKYMTPPSTATTPEQQTQQKMMRIMMVVMMPVFLYSAPSGLTLYILTSSTIGIFESRYIRAHVKNMDLKPKKKSPKRKADAQGRAFQRAVAAAKEKQQRRQQGSNKRFKKRR
jgi:YidC/Oxa1 family membrane protein insertase